MARPMEQPEASSHSDPAAAERRSARAIVSGRIVDIGGLPVLLQATDLRRAHAAAGLLCDLPSHPGPALLKLRFSAERPELPRRAPEQSDGDFRVWRSGGGLELGYGKGMGGSVVSDSAEIGGHDLDLRRAFRQIFPLVVSHLLAPFGRFVIHAAGIEVAGSGVVVVGGSGSGKSSVLVAAAQEGWTALSDDLVVVRAGAAGCEILGIRRAVAGPPEVVDLTDPRTQPIANDPRGRWVVPVDRWSGGWHPAGAVLMTAHARARCSTLHPRSGTDLFPPVIESFLALGGSDHLRPWFPIAATLSRLPGWELRHGRDPAQRLVAARRLLAAVATHLPVAHG